MDIQTLVNTMVSQLPAVAPEIILALVGVGVLLADMYSAEGNKGFLSTLAALGALGALGGLYWTNQFGGGALLGGMFYSDTFSIFLRATLYAGLFVLILSSRDYVSRTGMPTGEFLTLLILSVVGAGLMVGAADLIAFYIGLELLSVSSYVMAGMHLGDDRSEEASLKYFLNGALSSAIVLFGMSLVYGLTGATSLEGIAAGLTAGTADVPVLVTALVFVVAGLGFKLAAVPFHLWVPDTYEGSPTPVAAFLSVFSKGAALGAALRIFYIGFGPAAEHWTLLFIVLSAASMTWGNVTALVQDNAKRLFGYSSVAQVGYIMMGLAVGTELGISATLFYVLAYMFTNLGAFAVIMAVTNAGGSSKIAAFNGLSQRSPFLAFAMVVFALSLVGIPFTAGFFGKFYLIGAAVDGGLSWLAIFAALNSVISVAYYYKFITAMYLKEIPEHLLTADGDGAAVPAMAGGSGLIAPGSEARILAQDGPAGPASETRARDDGAGARQGAPEAGEPTAAFKPAPSLQFAVILALIGTVAIGIAPMFIDWATSGGLALF